MKNIGRKVVIIVFVALWLLAAGMGSRLYPKADMVGIRYTEGGLTGENLAGLLENGKNPDAQITAWSMEYGLEVEAPSIGNKLSMAAVLIYGDSWPAFSEELKNGVWMAGYDEGGCMLSSKAASRLFGTTDVIGLSVLCKGRKWMIRGVIDKQASVIVLPAKEKNKLPFLELSFPGQDSPSDYARRFLEGADGGSYTLYDWGLLGAVARVFSCLPGWPLMLALLSGSVKAAKASGIRFFRVGSLCLLAGGILLLCCFTFSFPGDWIPTRWSDLAFWRERIFYLTDMMAGLWGMAQYDGDAWMGRQLLVCISASIAAVCLLVGWLGRRRE